MKNSNLFFAFPSRVLVSIFLIFSVFLTSCEKDNNEGNDDKPQQVHHQLGLIPTPPSVYANIPNAPSPAPSGTLPSSFFLEIPSIAFNQGTELGSCASCAATEGKSILDHIQFSSPYPNGGIIYSPAFLFNQCHVDPNDCSIGSYVTSNLDLLVSQGICKLSEMNYNLSNCSTLPTANQKDLAASNKIDSYFKLDPINNTWIKEYIYSGLPVLIVFQVDDYFANATANSIWKQFSSDSRGFHCTLLYGWDDSKNAFKMLNSWGGNWGNNGTIWVDFNFVQNGSSLIYGKIFTEAYVMQNTAETSNMPDAQFTTDGSNTITTGESVSFVDQSSNSPTSWSWSFPGGTPRYSDLKDPVVTYNNSNSYDVSLTVTNEVGSNSITKQEYITVNSNHTWTCGQPFTDPRDGNTYSTVSIDGQCWMAENLKYTKNGSVGVNYKNSSSNYNTYGRLYSFNEVLNSNIEPPGWHVPSYSEIKSLEHYAFSLYKSNYGGAMKSTSNLWASPNTRADNVTGFSALPSGMFFDGTFSDLGFVFYMWTKTPQGVHGGGEASFLMFDHSGTGAGYFIGGHYFAVRCIKD